MSNIVDQFGRAIETGTLTAPRVAPLAGVRQIDYNPVSPGLSPGKLGRILRDAKAGSPTAFFELAEEMEETYLHYASVMQTRKLSITGLAVEVEAASDSPVHVEHAALIKKVVLSPKFRGLISQLVDALAKGFSVSEIEWGFGRLWLPKAYHWIPQRWLTFDKETRSEVRLRSMALSGEPLAPYKFIVHAPMQTGNPLSKGLAFLCAVAYMISTFTLKDWLGFLEVYGLPLRIGKYHNSATADDIEALKSAVMNLGSDFAAVLPQSMNIELPQAVSKASVDAFERLADWINRQVSKAVLGQTMTTEDGASLSQAQVHDSVKDDLLRADALDLGDSLNSQLVQPIIDLNFGVQESYPRIILPVPEAENLELLLQVVEKIGPQLKIPLKYVRDKFGIPDAAPGEELYGQAPVEKVSDKASDKPIVARERALNSRQKVPDLGGGFLDHWEQTMESVLDPFLNMREENLEDLLTKIDSMELDLAEVVRHLGPDLVRARLGIENG